MEMEAAYVASCHRRLDALAGGHEDRRVRTTVREFGRNFTRLRSLSWTPTKFQIELLKRKGHL